jgi:hypothetical protein
VVRPTPGLDGGCRIFVQSLRTELEHARGRIAARTGDAARARDWLAATAARCEHDDRARAAEILADAVLPALRAGSPADAVRLARRSMSLARGACDRVELHSTLLLGVAMLFAGDYDEGIALIEQVDMLEIRNGPSSPGGSRIHIWVPRSPVLAGTAEPASYLRA